jgi:zinc/manganese transport system substrate-binding protein
MKRITCALAALALALFCAGAVSAAKIEVIASLPELADIAKQVGGDRVDVYSIAKPNQDYHTIEPRPSDVRRIADADLIVRVGMDLDLWLDALLNASGSRDVSKGGRGYVDASVGVARLEVPKGQISGASGDIHVYGNPHYFYDPMNAKIIARNISNGLARVSPGNKAYFAANCETFADEIDRRMKVWQQELKPFEGRQAVLYHRGAVYFLRRFGIKDFDELESKPGIPPSPGHVRDLIARMKEHGVKAIVIESVYPKRFPEMVASETGGRLVVTPYSVGALGTKSYFDLMDLWVERYKEALR